jgi:hypothetical protein
MAAQLWNLAISGNLVKIAAHMVLSVALQEKTILIVTKHLIVRARRPSDVRVQHEEHMQASGKYALEIAPMPWNAVVAEHRATS